MSPNDFKRQLETLLEYILYFKTKLIVEAAPLTMNRAGLFQPLSHAILTRPMFS